MQKNSLVRIILIFIHVVFESRANHQHEAGASRPFNSNGANIFNPETRYFNRVSLRKFETNYSNRINHMEFYKNLSRPSKSYSSISNSYFNQNFIQKPAMKVSCGTRTVDFNPRRMAKIVGGSESPYGAIPWQVEIQLLSSDSLTFEHHCGGAVIGQRLAISAAHCFDMHPLKLEHIRVVTGEHRLKIRDQHENRFLVEKVIPHPEFRKDGPHSNDIALITVKARGTGGIQFNSHVRPICLPDADGAGDTDKLDEAGTWCTVSGWGWETESTESFAPVLKAAAVPVLDLTTCRKNQVLGGRQQPILDSMICAGVLGGGVDACSGDSGGPLACVTSNRWQLAGVVSWGSGCARKARPGVYTRVASYLDWIRDTAKSLGHSLP